MSFPRQNWSRISQPGQLPAAKIKIKGFYRIYTKRPDRPDQTSVDPDQTAPKKQADHGLHCLRPTLGNNLLQKMDLSAFKEA